ncbi:MAG: starch-binding protein, partial [Muribaculaceae bacterium]|nr:starch-binding protein [Muribaculaceae bacterium]
MKSRLLSLVSAVVLPASMILADGVTIYYDNSATAWESVGIHYWGGPETQWPGVEIDHVEGNIWSYTFPSDTNGVSGFLFQHAT